MLKHIWAFSITIFLTKVPWKHVCWLCDLDLWPMTLKCGVDLDIVHRHLHARFMVMGSILRPWQCRRHWCLGHWCTEKHPNIPTWWNLRRPVCTGLNIQIKIALSVNKVRILIKILAQSHMAFVLGDKINRACRETDQSVVDLILPLFKAHAQQGFCTKQWTYGPTLY